MREAVIESVPPLVILEPDLRVRKANEAFYATFGVAAGQTEGRLIYELGNGQWNIPALRKLFGEILPQSKVFKNYEVTHDFETIGRRTMLMSGREVESMHAIVLSIEDISEREQKEEAVRTTAAIRATGDASSEAFSPRARRARMRKPGMRGPSASSATGPSDVIGRSVTLLIPPEGRDKEQQILAQLKRGEPIRHYETVRLAKDGRRLDVSLTISPIKDSQGRIIGASTIVRDIGDLVRARRWCWRGARRNWSGWWRSGRRSCRSWWASWSISPTRSRTTCGRRCARCRALPR